jgi:hypothetical protein
MVAAAVAGAAVVGAVGSSVAAKQGAKASRQASDAQSAAAYAQLDQQQAQFDRIRELLQPWVNQGTNANTSLGNLLGVGGNQAQQSAIEQLKQSPLYTSQLQAGENAILQNASATGGLRGGNTQMALGRFAPALLASTIQNQVQNLGGLSNQGLTAAGGVSSGLSGLSQANSSALQQLGAAQAGGALGAGNAYAGLANNLAGVGGSLAGYFGGSGGGGGAALGSGNVFGGAAASPVTGLNSGVQYPTGGGLF